jgi:hypothetical protein
VIADTACAAPGAAAASVYAPADAIRLEQLESVAGRWIASSPEGYVLFDRDGGNADGAPQQLAASFNVVASEGSTAGIVASGTVMQFLRIDEDGMTVNGPLGVDVDAPDAVAVASDSGDTLVVWAFNTKLEARPVSSGGVVGATFDVMAGAYSTFVFLEAAPREGSTGVVWTGDAELGTNTSFFVAIDPGGVPGEAVELLDTIETHSVSRIAATDDGWVVLFTGEPPDNEPLLMTLAPDGQPTSGLFRLDGARYAYDLASRGDGFAVVAGRASGEAELRAFDLDVVPAADWVCLGADHDEAAPAAIAVDGAGYAVLHTALSGEVLLHRLDALGTGAP